MESRRPKRSSEDTKAAVEEMLGIMFNQAKAQFGSAIKRRKTLISKRHYIPTSR